MASKTTDLSLLLLAATLASLAAPSAGVFHIIGAGKGWRIPASPTYYEDWARTRNVTVGDKLMFLYRSGVYDIVEVPTKELFDKCSMDNVTNRYQLGPTILKINVPGPRYYFCGVGKHCEQGQKVAIDVSPADQAAAAAAAAEQLAEQVVHQVDAAAASPATSTPVEDAAKTSTS